MNEILIKIENEKAILNQLIEKYGIKDKRVIKQNNKVDNLINIYYRKNKFVENFCKKMSKKGCTISIKIVK